MCVVELNCSLLRFSVSLQSVALFSVILPVSCYLYSDLSSLHCVRQVILGINKFCVNCIRVLILVSVKWSEMHMLCDRTV